MSQFTTSHNHIASHHITSHDLTTNHIAQPHRTTTSHNHIASQPHNIPSHCITSHHFTSLIGFSPLKLPTPARPGTTGMFLYLYLYLYCRFKKQYLFATLCSQYRKYQSLPHITNREKFGIQGLFEASGRPS